MISAYLITFDVIDIIQALEARKAFYFATNRRHS